MTAETTCVFCGIAQGTVPSATIARTDRAVAFMDINPVTLGHVLVVPLKHSTDLLDTVAEDLAASIELAQDVAGRVTERLGADGVNLLNCSGLAAWQSVFHFHLHVIPRYEDQPGRDAIGLPWAPVPGLADELQRVATLLR
jgi:histidine triad (HIT) family protein